MQIKSSEIKYLLETLEDVDNEVEFLKLFLEDFYENGKVVSSVETAILLLDSTVKPVDL